MMQIDSELLTHLQAYLVKMGLSVEQAKVEKLVAFVQLMDKWNKAYNLTSVRDPKEMLIKHIVDSIVITPHLSGQHYIDVGTGPGLPGIPLAIMLPDTQFVLLDSLGKRIRFIKQVTHELGLPNVQAVQSRVEAFHQHVPYDGVLSRAFASIKDMLHWCQHLVDSQGTFLALKGQFPAEEMDEIPANFKVCEVVKLDVPGLDAQRHLVKIQKI